MRYAYLVAAGAVLAGISVSMLTLVPKLTISKSVVNMHIHFQLMYCSDIFVPCFSSLLVLVRRCCSIRAIGCALAARLHSALHGHHSGERATEREEVREIVREKSDITCTAKAT